MRKSKRMLALLLGLVIALSVNAYVPVNAKAEGNNAVANKAQTEKVLTQQIFDAINAHRATKGLSAYTWSNSVAKVAKVRAKDISVKFAHERPDGSDFEELYIDSNVLFLSLAETLGYGSSDPTDIVDSWLSCPEHKDLIESSAYANCAVGVYIADDGSIYYTAEFYI